jgi:hypothetical protein
VTSKHKKDSLERACLLGEDVNTCNAWMPPQGIADEISMLIEVVRICFLLVSKVIYVAIQKG